MSLSLQPSHHHNYFQYHNCFCTPQGTPPQDTKWKKFPTSMDSPKIHNLHKTGIEQMVLPLWTLLCSVVCFLPQMVWWWWPDPGERWQADRAGRPAGQKRDRRSRCDLSPPPWSLPDGSLPGLTYWTTARNVRPAFRGRLKSGRLMTSWDREA